MRGRFGHRSSPATKHQLAECLRHFASRTMCLLHPDNLPHGWHYSMALVREAYELLGGAEHFWQIARAFGLVPTILYVHDSVTCPNKTIFTKEDSGHLVTCPTCLAARNVTAKINAGLGG